jgi:hypothetical protein
MDELLNEISHDEYLFSVQDYVQSAWIGHAPFLKFIIREQRPKNFVELGVHNGFSYFVACQAIKECNVNCSAFAIDNWVGDEQAGFFDDSVYEGVNVINTKYSDFSTLLKMNFSDALTQFGDSSIDLLHIDGFHSYESVRNDFESWISKMNSNGIILLHDIHVRRNSFGVYLFWKEVKSKFKTIEFVGSHGLGVVFLGEVPKGKLAQLFEIANSGNLSQIQGTFGSISDDVIQGSRMGEISAAVAERDVAVAERDVAVAERDAAVAERDAAVAERDAAVAERDAAVAERDAAVAERDAAVAERDLIVNSTIWRLFAPYRKSLTLIRSN